MSTSLVVNRSSKERTWQFCLLERGLGEFCSQTSRIRYQDTHKVLLFPAVVPPDPLHSLHRQQFLSVPLAALTSSNPLFSLPCFSLHVSLSLPSSPSHTGPEDSPSICVLLASVPLGRHPGQILLGRSDYALGHLASHMPRSGWHHTHPGSLGPDTPGNTDSLEGLCDLVSFIWLPRFQVSSKCS